MVAFDRQSTSLREFRGLNHISEDIRPGDVVMLMSANAESTFPNNLIYRSLVIDERRFDIRNYQGLVHHRIV